MTDLINQITINGETTTFLNYVNPVVSAEAVTYHRDNIDLLLTAHWGADPQKWYSYPYSFVGAHITVRFPTPFETRTGTLDNGGNYNNIMSNGRAYFSSGSVVLQSGNGNSVGSNISITTGANLGTYLFGVIDNYSMSLVSFSAATRGAITGFINFGWLKDGIYTESQYPRNLYSLHINAGRRVATENLSNLTNVTVQNPSLSCSTATPGANSTDLLFRDSTAPNNYIGRVRHTMILPSSAVVGKIYRNEGLDPDTGVIETDQKAYWMCVGSWGTDKIGMRVWTDNII